MYLATIITAISIILSMFISIDKPVTIVDEIYEPVQIVTIKSAVKTKKPSVAPLKNVPKKNEPVIKPQSVSTGSCEDVRNRLFRYGISGSELNAAVQLSQLESGCRVQASNPSSGACNYFQEWPCGKWGGTNNTDAHIRGAIGYARASYGTFNNALSIWHSRNPHWW